MLNPNTVLVSHPIDSSMPDHDTSTDGPFTLPEFKRRLAEGQIHKNTMVRMPDGREWMLLPSFLNSSPTSGSLVKRLACLRKETAYRPVRWLVSVVAWLAYISAAEIFLFGHFLNFPINSIEWEVPGFVVRFGFAFLLGLAGKVVEATGLMFVDLFDTLLGMQVLRVNASENDSQMRSPHSERGV